MSKKDVDNAIKLFPPKKFRTQKIKTLSAGFVPCNKQAYDFEYIAKTFTHNNNIKVAKVLFYNNNALFFVFDKNNIELKAKNTYDIYEKRLNVHYSLLSPDCMKSYFFFVTNTPKHLEENISRYTAYANNLYNSKKMFAGYDTRYTDSCDITPSEVEKYINRFS